MHVSDHKFLKLYNHTNTMAYLRQYISKFFTSLLKFVSNQTKTIFLEYIEYKL